MQRLTQGGLINVMPRHILRDSTLRVAGAMRHITPLNVPISKSPPFDIRC